MRSYKLQCSGLTYRVLGYIQWNNVGGDTHLVSWQYSLEVAGRYSPEVAGGEYLEVCGDVGVERHGREDDGERVEGEARAEQLGRQLEVLVRPLVVVFDDDRQRHLVEARLFCSRQHRRVCTLAYGIV